MSQRHRTALKPAIALLAAGQSSRLGQPKQLLAMGSISLLRHMALLALSSDCPCHVVLGFEAQRMRREVDDLALECHINQDWSQGMGGSISVVAQALLNNAPARAMLILPVDLPLLSLDDLQLLLHSHAQQPDAIFAAARGEQGVTPPCLFPADLLDSLSRLHQQPGARQVIEAHRPRLNRLPMPAALLDLDTPEDLQAWAG